MANEQNLTPFTKDRQPAKNGRKKGVPNRATVFKNLLKMKTKVMDPNNPNGPKIEVSLLEAAALGQFQSAMKGNTRAFQEIQDTLHGKIPNKEEHTGADGGPIEVATFQITTRKENDSDG